MIEFRHHQKVAYAYLGLNDYYALFMEQGTGKTLPMLVHMDRLLKKDKIKNFLVIAPKAVMGSWERDIEKLEPDQQARLKDAMLIINYDRVWQKKTKVNKAGKKIVKLGTRDEIDKQWDAIILDESHYIKNRTTNRTKIILNLAIQAKYKYLMTGTPIGNGHLENIWSQFAFLSCEKNERGNIVNKLIENATYQAFQDKYCILNRYYQPYKYLRVDELQEIIEAHSFRVTKEECLDLPEKLPDEIYQIEMSADQKKYYKRLVKDHALAEFDVLASNSLALNLKLRQLSSGYISTDNGEVTEVKNGKLSTLKTFIEDYEKKLVIFAQFKHSIQSISKMLKKMKIKYVTLDGDQDNKLIWRDFQSDESIRIIICQYESASAGIDLFSADTTIYYEPTLRSTTLEQSRDRIHRIGQSNKCSYIHFITTGSVEKDIFNALARFEDFSTALFEETLLTYTNGYNPKGR